MAGLLQMGLDPRQQGLLTLAAGLLQGSGASRLPRYTGANIGQSIGPALQQQAQAQQFQMQQETARQQQQAAVLQQALMQRELDTPARPDYSHYQKVGDELVDLRGPTPSTVPGVGGTKQYSGGLEFDSKVGKFYQTNPKTGKREYTSPPSSFEATLPDGTTLRYGASRGGITGNKRDELRGEQSQLDRAYDRLTEALEGIDRDRSTAGAVGTVKRKIQTGLSVVADALREFPPLAENDILKNLAEPSIGEMFNPTLPEFTVLENSLAYALARARKPTGRLNKNDVDSARNDVTLQGVTSADDVKARLNVIKREIDDARADLQSRITGQPGPAVSNSPGRGGIRPAPPEVGDIKRGWKFMGGSPSDPNNWEKQ